MKLLFISIVLLFFMGCESNNEATVIETKQNENYKTQENKYTLKTTNNEKINIELINKLLLSKELNGKIVLLNFWATWCPPCKKEMPAFVKLQEKYKDKFIIVGILMEKEKNKEELQEFLDKYKINFPITIDGDNFLLAKDLADVKRYPESYLFSKEGMLIKSFIGEVNQNILESFILEETVQNFVSNPDS